ncbi:MAG: hypothetical protein E7548_06095 [Ruminococcaceae bacterium]|nr:hypothetical protein [Oscillospiraceae bacterium]
MSAKEFYINVRDRKIEAFIYDGFLETKIGNSPLHKHKYTEVHFTERGECRIVVGDRVGGGDSFGAGLIYALHSGFDAQQIIEYAAAASCLKQTIELDVNLSKPSDILALVGGDSSGRVQR